MRALSPGDPRTPMDCVVWSESNPPLFCPKTCRPPSPLCAVTFTLGPGGNSTRTRPMPTVTLTSVVPGKVHVAQIDDEVAHGQLVAGLDLRGRGGVPLTQPDAA